MLLNPLRQKIADGKPVIGPLFQEIPDSLELVEYFGRAGFDYVMIDGEHAGVHVSFARDVCRAAEASGICALARVPDTDPGRILALLDSGVQGIILAHCATVADAEALVKACKYPPRGIRGASSGSRAALYGYGPSSGEKMDIFDRETMCFGLIEDESALPHIEDMLKIDGYDGNFLGAGDMALSMNRSYLGMQPSHPDVQAAMNKVRDQTLAAGKLVMVPAGNGTAAKAAIDSGIQMIVVQFGQMFRTALNSYLDAAYGR
ncbi:MAG: HpcH/HpaI aldolase/citrate lyase family protein [Chloroflexota bacterium]